MTANGPITDEELLALIESEERAALGSSSASGPIVGPTTGSQNQTISTLEVDRYNALNAYFARPFGNEVDDRSSIILPEVRDTIEWAMPTLMRIFAAAQHVCEFDPVGPDDEQQATLETQVVNHVFMRQNNGFFILYDTIKDALILRNGYGKVSWQREDKVRTERMEGVTAMQVAMVLQQTNDEIEIVSQQERQQITPLGPETVHDLVIRRTIRGGRIVVEAIPPEEVLVSAMCRGSTREASFAEHKTRKTRSQLIEMGYAPSVIDELPMAQDAQSYDMVALARNQVVDQNTLTHDTFDSSTQDLRYREVYLRVDRDGDGVAELRRICIVADTIVSDEEWEEIPIFSLTPMRMPHRHMGISYVDVLFDLMFLKSTLFRQGLDNIYQANNQRIAADFNTTNLPDLQSNRLGGVVRTNGDPHGILMQLGSDTSLMQQIMPVLGYVDNLREMRTGIGADTMGVDADALQDVTKGGQLAAMSAAAMKVELVARLLAEGVKDMFMLIHSTLMRHQNRPLVLQIAGRWVESNPAEWRDRLQVSVNVGLGSGAREEVRQNIMLMMQLQQQMGQFGLVGPQQAYETFKRAAHVLGFENPEKFALDPASPAYQQAMSQRQPPPPDPRIVAAQITAQQRQQESQADASIQQMKLQHALADVQARNEREMMALDATIAQKHHEMLIKVEQMQTAFQENLLRVVGNIVAQQLRQQPQIDAGAVLAGDVQQVQDGLQ